MAAMFLYRLISSQLRMRTGAPQSLWYFYRAISFVYQ